MARYRLVHVGTAALLSAGVMTTVGVAQSVLARPSLGTASSFVPIKPCRLMDTRAASAVGTRTTPIGAAETATVAVWGAQGNCFIPDNATGIAANVTAVNPSAYSYLTVFPAEGIRPTTSNLNWRAGSQPVPNHVAVGLPAAPLNLSPERTDIVIVDGLPTVPGAIRLYNRDGTVDVVIDITGYFEPAVAGEQGPQGEPGKDGAPGVGDLGCLAGQTVTWNDEDGVWLCADPVVDNDTLAGLECHAESIALFGVEGWQCVDPAPDADTLGALECQANSIPFYDGEGWFCIDRVTDSDTLALLGTRCNAGMTVQWNGEAWACVDPVVDTDTLAGLQCTIDQLVKWNGEAWACVDPVVDADTLAGLQCTIDQLIKWSGEAWTCVDPVVDTDTDTDTLADLECAPGQTITWNGHVWVCVDPVVDTLGTLTCPLDWLVGWNGQAWQCYPNPYHINTSVDPLKTPIDYVFDFPVAT